MDTPLIKRESLSLRGKLLVGVSTLFVGSTIWFHLIFPRPILYRSTAILTVDQKFSNLLCHLYVGEREGEQRREGRGMITSPP